MTRTTNRTAARQTMDDTVAERAYGIWETEGRPEGRDQEHWLRAEAEIRYETGSPVDAKPGRPQTARLQVPARGDDAPAGSIRRDGAATAAQQPAAKRH